MSEFRPLAPGGTGRFAPWGNPVAPVATEAPVDAQSARMQAWAEGYDAGHAAASDELAIRVAEEDAARALLTDALVRFRPQPPEALAARLARGVHDMVEAIVATCPVTVEELADRCIAMLEQVARDEGSVSLRLHPDDAALIHEADPEIHLTADPAMPRGSLRLMLAGGDRIDGRAERLAQLADDLDIAP